MYNRNQITSANYKCKVVEQYWKFHFSLIPIDPCGGRVLSPTKLTPIYAKKAARMTYQYYWALAQHIKNENNDCMTHREKYTKIKHINNAAKYITELFPEYF